MLRNRGIRTKLLAVLALPIVVLMIGAAVISTQGFARAGQAAKVEKLAAGAGSLGDLVVRIHQERILALQVISGRANGNKVAELKRAQGATDLTLQETREFVNSLDLGSLSQESVDAVKASEEAHNKLGAVRADIASGHAQADQVAARYDAMIALDVALPQRIGDSLTDRSIGRSLAAYSALSNLVELASQEAELGAAVIADHGVDPATAVQLSSLQGVQTQAIQTFRLNAKQSQVEALDAALFQPIDERAAFTSERLDIVASLQGTPITTPQGEWIKTSAARVKAIRAQLDPLATQTAEDAATAAAAARRQAVLLLGLGLAVVALLVGLGLVLARAMTRPLRRLTVTAGAVAEELPRMVERMATPGEGPGITLPEIHVDSKDEVGQLAQAFKNVNETTLRVAEEQAALRASIAEMFVNVARRNHVLLSRQLSFIDQLERTEENPDTLDNLFKLDHLATRMRRNAESLIVLAGIDAGRRLRRPMPLSDVIRTAVSEIERYDRVDLALQADPPLVGHVALTSAHMIAELLENATQFSNPDTRVVTATAFSNAGVRITITDLGLGMTWDEITDANQRIANPPVTDVVGSQRLGFYVVGRLARRLDATVSLRPGRTQGTVVTIDLPPALFVPGTVTELPTAEVDAAPAELEPAEITADGSGGGSVLASSAPVLPQVPVLPQLPVVSPAPSASTTLTQAPVETSSGLPRRGQSAGPAESLATVPEQARVEPRVPVLPAPSFPTVAEPAADGELPQRGARDTAIVEPDVEPIVEPDVEPDVELDVESEAGVDVEAVVEAVVESTVEPAPAEAPAGPRGGIFSNFRSRRAVEETGDAPQPAAAFSLPAMNTPLDDEPTFVPVLDESEPALPTRDLYEPGPLDAGWVPETIVAEPVVEAVEVQPEVEAVEVEPEVEAVEVEAPIALAEPDPEPVPLVAPEPVVLAEPDPEPVPLVAPEPVAVAEVDIPEVSAPVSHLGEARSALTELARETQADSVEPVQPEHEAEPAASVPAAVQAEPEPAEEAAYAPAFPVNGVPSMDILPSRSGRGLLGRRGSKSAPAPAPKVEQRPTPSVAPVTPRPAVAPEVPAARRLDDEPAQPAAANAESFAAPNFGSPTPSFAEPASTSLFGRPPSASVEAGPAPSSMFPAAPVEPAPTVPTPAVPALAAAATLRERSAMASEALSELSALSTYSPQTVEPGAPVALQRRTPLATEAGQLSSQDQDDDQVGSRRGARNAADVRTMLSGFRAGVERGRTSPAGHQSAGDKGDG